MKICMDDQIVRIINDICKSFPALRREGNTAARGPQDQIIELINNVSQKVEEEHQIVIGKINSPNEVSVEFHDVTLIENVPCERLIRSLCEERLQNISKEKYQINIEEERITLEYDDHIPISEVSMDGNYLARTFCQHNPSTQKIIEEYKLRSSITLEGPSIRNKLGHAKISQILENNELSCPCGGKFSQMLKSGNNIAHCTRCGKGITIESPWTSRNIHIS